jgi:hypothetical protein
MSGESQVNFDGISPSAWKEALLSFRGGPDRSWGRFLYTNQQIFESPLLLNLNLSPLISCNLGHAPISCDLAGDTYLQPFVLAFGRPKLSAIGAPNQNGENLSGIGLIEVQKSRFALRTLRVVSAGYFPAYRHPIAHVIFGLDGGDLF